MTMTDKKYKTPTCDFREISAGGLICASGDASGDKYDGGSDFGGKDKWEVVKW